MRFDDRLETVLKIDPAHESGRISIWRQLVDMLAQSGHILSPEAAQKSFVALAMLRPRVPLTVRAASIRPVAQRVSYAPLVAFLANDHPQVAIACVDNARLSCTDWLSILAELGPVGRSRLRARGDIDEDVVRALAAYGARDYALADHRAQDASGTVGFSETLDMDQPVADGLPTSPHSDIAELVRRIDRYRAQREQPTVPVCRIRCDGEGEVRAVSGVARGRFVGLSLAQPARPAQTGCDAGVARAFAKRAPIRDGRIFISGDGPDSGYWRIVADPQFDRESGRFCGYAGDLCRLANDAGAQAPLADTAEAGFDHPAAEGMRQLVHELRSPLNAISGFAQLINGQFFGPVSQTYRAIAGSIMADAQQLASALKDMDLAARLDSGRISAVAGSSFIPSVFADISARQAARGDATAILESEAGNGDAAISLPASDAADIIDKLLSALHQLRGAGGPLPVQLGQDSEHGMATLIFPIRPAFNRDELARALDHDASITPEQGTAVLGPGFGLRLAGQLAQLHGGALIVEADQCILNLPLVDGDASRFVAASEPSIVAAP